MRPLGTLGGQGIVGVPIMRENLDLEKLRDLVQKDSNYSFTSGDLNLRSFPCQSISAPYEAVKLIRARLQ